MSSSCFSPVRDWSAVYSGLGTFAARNTNYRQKTSNEHPTRKSTTPVVISGKPKSSDTEHSEPPAKKQHRDSHCTAKHKNCTNVLSDQDSINLSLYLHNVPSQGPGVWRLNLDLLEDENFCAIISWTIQLHVLYKAFSS